MEPSTRRVDGSESALLKELWLLARFKLFWEDRVVGLVHAEIRSGSVRRHDAERDALGRVRRCRDEERRLKTAFRAGVEQLQSLDHAVADQYFPVDGHLSGIPIAVRPDQG